jgi:dTMP kinase
MLAVPGDPLCPLRALLFASIANTPPIANNGIAIARKMKIIATLPTLTSILSLLCAGCNLTVLRTAAAQSLCGNLKSMSRGYFITFEGLDGSGKTTQLRRLAASLEAEGHNVVTLRQPGGTALGDRIRSVLLDSKSEAALGPIAPAAEMALMFADRAQSIDEIILPALNQSKIVLCDRYTDSSEAYQGGGRQLGSQRILEMHAAACNNLQPDLTILLLPSLEASLKRARRRNQRNVQQQGADENRFERESDDFYRRIYEKYEEIAAREPHRVAVIRDDASIDEIETRIKQIVAARLTQPTP